MSERVSLHIWPSCKQVGRKIGLGMASLHLLIYSTFLAWIINNSDPNWPKVYDHHEDKTSTELYKKWVEETSTRLQITGIICLVIGWITFPLIVCQFFYQKKYVASIVTSHLSEKEKNVEEEMHAANKGKEEQEVKDGDGGQNKENESQEEDERKEDGQEYFVTEKVMDEEKGAKEGKEENREKDKEEEVEREKHLGSI